MKVTVDTSVLVELDRGNRQVADLLAKLTEHTVELVVSTVTVSEILTGAYLTKEAIASIRTAKEILGQFVWIPLDGDVAAKTAQMLAFLFAHRLSVSYPDVAIAATCTATGSDYLLTLNKKDFQVLPHLAGRVLTPDEFKKTVKLPGKG